MDGLQPWRALTDACKWHMVRTWRYCTRKPAVMENPIQMLADA